MLLSIVLVILGLFLLVVGGEALLRGAVGLATLLKLTPAVIGLTVVAAGTSVPELAVSAIAAWEDKVDIAVANVVGSNIFNITVIIGMCAVIYPLTIVGNTIQLEYPVLVIVTLLCLVIAQDGSINFLDAILCIVIYVGFTAYLVSLVRQQLTVSQKEVLQSEVKELTVDPAKPRFWKCALFIITGSALLAGGAHSTVTGAAELARMLGWTERIIGLTIVSIGTGLPEVVASLVSSIRGRSDMAIGNVIGSNLFNILMILGLSGLMRPLPVQESILQMDCRWMMAVTLVLFPLMFTGKKINRWEGVLLLLVYAVYLFLLITVPF